MQTSLRKHHKFRHKLLKWHHRVGVLAALFVLLLASTGLLLNHSDTLGFPQKTVQASWLVQWYGIKSPDIKSYSVNDDWISHLGGNHLYLNNAEMVACAGPLRGALPLGGSIVALCGQELVVLTVDGELVERMGAIHGLPIDPLALGRLEQKLVLRNQQGEFIADLENMNWQASVASASTITWAQDATPPKYLQQGLIRKFSGAELSLERVMLDLHSGRLLGSWGPYLMDAMAILFCVLAVTGVWVWATRPGHVGYRK